MQSHLKSPDHQEKLLFHTDIKQPISTICLGFQQQWKLTQDSFNSGLNHCINRMQQKFQIPNNLTGLKLPFTNLGFESKCEHSKRCGDWHTQLKKTGETMEMHVGRTLQVGKDKLAEVFGWKSQRKTMWACSSVSQNLPKSDFEAQHLFDLAMSSKEISKRLDGIPVYTVSNSAKEFVLVSDMHNQKSIGLFCFRQQDAEGLLSQVIGTEPKMGGRAKVIAVSLNKVYELRKEGITLRFLPDPRQVKNALQTASKAGIPGHSFPGVPVFQSNNLILRSHDKRFRPIFFSKEDLEGSLARAFQKQKKINPSFDVSTDIQVGSFEDVIRRMESGEENSAWEEIVFIPPGLDVFDHVGKTGSAQFPSDGTAFC